MVTHNTSKLNIVDALCSLILNSYLIPTFSLETSVESVGSLGDEFKASIVNQFLVARVNSPYILNGPTLQMPEAVLHLISLLVVRESGYLEVLEK